ncbi:MAG TPA: hypothetical protein VFG90_08270 [Nitrososphaeraceae archaeon]|nr:hypothetical protein [Nitrososphaeraceae archaeon]
MRKNTKNINDEYYQKKGYKDEDLNIRGKPKRGLVSFQCEEKLWREFDKKVERQYGKYKKSYIIESLIREYMTTMNDNGEGTDYR